MLLEDGLVLASDSRSNAGVDQITSVCKMSLFEHHGTRALAVLSGGNLATTQAVVSTLEQRLGNGDPHRDLFAAATMFDAAQVVADTLRAILERDAESVSAFGDPGGTFIFGGQIEGARPQLYQVYSAGNFIRASERTPFLQIGETKYGKPILDRALAADTDLARAAKLALISFDATMRSNLSVAPPIDLVCYQEGALSFPNRYLYDEGDDYFATLRAAYSAGISELVERLPDLPNFPSGKPADK